MYFCLRILKIFNDLMGMGVPGTLPCRYFKIPIFVSKFSGF